MTRADGGRAGGAPAWAMVLKWRYLAVSVCYLVAALLGDKNEGDVIYYRAAFRTLHHHGLSLYAIHPDIQIGPLALVLGWALNGLTDNWFDLAILPLALGLLVALLREVDALAAQELGPSEARRTAVLVGGCALAVPWSYAVPRYGHVEDLAALVALVAAVHLGRAGRTVAVGVLLGVVVALKPWGAYLLALIVLLPGWRSPARALMAALAVGAAAWLPFLLWAPRTLGALSHFANGTYVGSLPWLLGDATAPHWVRPVQFLATTLAVVVAVRRGRWPLALLLYAVCRLATDADTFAYYDVELLTGTLVADVLGVLPRFPRLGRIAPLTVLALLSEQASRPLRDHPMFFVSREGTYAGLVLLGWFLVRPARTPVEPLPGTGEPTLPLNVEHLRADTPVTRAYATPR